MIRFPVRTRGLHTYQNERHCDHKGEQISTQGFIVFAVSLCKELQAFEDVVLAQSLIEKKDEEFVIYICAQSFL